MSLLSLRSEESFWYLKNNMAHFTKHKYNKDARDAIMRGAEKVHRLVATTQGPRGRNIAINKGYDVEILHDGLKVSRFINPEDKFENIGASILREASEEQAAKVGDGTTLTIVLGYEIAREAMVLIDSGVNAMSLTRSLEKGRNILIEEIKKLSKPIKTEREKIQIATIASEDAKLGEMIGSTYHKIGADGVIIADESKSHETRIEHQEGITIDHGFLSPYFITDPRNLTATIKDAHILFLERELSDVYEFVPFVESVLKPKEIRNIVIIAKDVTGNALASLIETKRRGLMNILCIKAPSFGKYQQEMMTDIATMCGGTVVDEASKKPLKEIPFEYLGFAGTVKSSRDSTTILENKGSVKKIKDRIFSIRELLKDPDSDLDQEKLKERLSKMTGGVYVIKTGGATEPEMNERKERVDDAIKATRAAIEGGIVPGGEVPFLTARNMLKATDENEQYAYRILSKAVEKPFDKLLSNAGLNPGYYMAKLEDKPFGWGVDVVNNEFVNLIDRGIVDPALVLTEALRSAVSVAILLCCSDGATAMYQEKDEK